ncbi:LuxR C-terminal-related transcriptional regulator [Streptomyces sp. DW26H14]|uniref:LuxR C-terminal-related transcriptional regulator n=1 Tax=Streptomyces sp. DW26H14 TaxID=3435395 RepID=UPI00403DD062
MSTVRDRTAIQGRDDELGLLRRALADGAPSLTVLRGPAGIGRTSLLATVGRTLCAEGWRVLPARPAGDRADAFGATALVRAVRDHFEQFEDAGLADALGSVARADALGPVGRADTFGPTARADAAEGAVSAGWDPGTVAAFDVLFGRLARQGRVAVLVDDAQDIAEPAPLLDAARRAGCPVLAAVREEGAALSRGLVELLSTADRVVALGPLADDVAESLVRRAAGTRPDEAVPVALRAALGPLFTRPGTLLRTVAALRANGRLVSHRGRTCLRDPARPIELPADDHLLRRVGGLGDLAERLTASVAVWEGAAVDDLTLLAGVLGVRPDDCGRMLDTLVDADVLVVDAEGRVRCRCPALAASAARWSQDGRGTVLHAELAGRLLAGGRQYAGAGLEALGDHVARGGTAVALDTETVRRLLAMAAAEANDQPERATLWCAAALNRLPQDGSAYATGLALLVDLVIRTGRYEVLRSVLSRYAEGGCAAGNLAQMRLAAVLLALHTGEPPAEEPLRALLDEELPGREPLSFSLWWFGHRLAPTAGRPAPHGPVHWAGGDAPVSSEELELLSAALYGSSEGCERLWHPPGRAADTPDQRRLREAASVVDMAAVARIVAGPRYRLRPDGVLGTYHRVVRGYGSGDWPGAHSAVRELELSSSVETLAHHAARLFAADMCAARGEFRQAAEWLADAAPVPRLAALRIWVRVGLFAKRGESREAIELARRAGRRLRAAGLYAGLDLLLTRAVRTAVDARDHEGAGALLDEIELLHRDGARVHATDELRLARGLVHGDLAATRDAVGLARERGRSVPALLESCLAVARLADDPRPWLREAHELATRCGASLLIKQIRSLSHERGVSAPRARSRREALADAERRVVELLGEGLTNRQIALRLGMGEKTVEQYLTRLFARTGCRSRVDLVAAALAGRLVPVEP